MLPHISLHLVPYEFESELAHLLVPVFVFVSVFVSASVFVSIFVSVSVSVFVYLPVFVSVFVFFVCVRTIGCVCVRFCIFVSVCVCVCVRTIGNRIFEVLAFDLSRSYIPFTCGHFVLRLVFFSLRRDEIMTLFWLLCDQPHGRQILNLQCIVVSILRNMPFHV